MEYFTIFGISVNTVKLLVLTPASDVHRLASSAQLTYTAPRGTVETGEELKSLTVYVLPNHNDSYWVTGLATSRTASPSKISEKSILRIFRFSCFQNSEIFETLKFWKIWNRYFRKIRTFFDFVFFRFSNIFQYIFVGWTSIFFVVKVRSRSCCTWGSEAGNPIGIGMVRKDITRQAF